MNFNEMRTHEMRTSLRLKQRKGELYRFKKMRGIIKMNVSHIKKRQENYMYSRKFHQKVKSGPSKTGQQRRDSSASTEYKWRSGIEGAETSGRATYFNQ